MSAATVRVNGLDLTGEVIERALSEITGALELAAEAMTGLSCMEVEQLAAGLRLVGLDDTAESLIEAHGEDDDAGDLHYQGEGDE